MCRHHNHACIFFKGFPTASIWRLSYCATASQTAYAWARMAVGWGSRPPDSGLHRLCGSLEPSLTATCLGCWLCQRAAVCWCSSRITSQQVPLRMPTLCPLLFPPAFSSSSIGSECLPSILWVTARSLQPHTLSDGKWKHIRMWIPRTVSENLHLLNRLWPTTATSNIFNRGQSFCVFFVIFLSISALHVLKVLQIHVYYLLKWNTWIVLAFLQ